MTDWLQRCARERPASPALIAGDDRISWAELADLAGRGAAHLAERGVAPGTTVAWTARARPASIAWLHAVWWRGASLLPLAPDLLTDRSKALVDGLDVRAWIGPAGDAPRHRVRIDDTRPPAAGPSVPARSHAATDPVTWMPTSGSSGWASRIALHARHHEASARAVAQRLSLTARDRWLLCLPLDHIGGLSILVRAVMIGSAVIVEPRFDAARIRASLARDAPTLASMVPTMLTRLLASGEEPVRNQLRGLLIGGAPAEPDLLARARDAGLPVLPTWGMTEAASQLATLTPDEAAGLDFAAHPGIAGRPLPGVELSIVDTDGDGHGRLRVRGPMVFDGDPAHPRPADRWFETGDRGFVDELGRLHVTGRASDRIISGGANVSAAAVERALRASGLVRDVAVLGLDDPEWGQRVAAVVVPGTGTDRAALDDWSRTHLEPAQRPRSWRLVQTIPRSSAEKPDREGLLALLSASPGDRE